VLSISKSVLIVCADFGANFRQHRTCIKKEVAFILHVNVPVDLARRDTEIMIDIYIVSTNSYTMYN
jgi:hypothetical protein